jgi:phenylpropionate dioxygenase-like ring-hydroxylating dioxygenase large terminal subunit
MLSAQDNDILTRVGRGTPMGELMRRFWIPALLAEEVAVPDGKPVRVRLLGENLVAFRDTAGNIGLLDEHCPHRRSSLALGLNEDGGLRCIYHGYKFTTAGTCVDAPTEPAESGVLAKMRARSYPVREAGSMIWTYMGPADQQPAFPEFEWLNMPKTHSVPFKIMGECNYAQMVEGTVDSAHAGVLHKRKPWGAPATFDFERDLAPRIEIEQTIYGMRYAGLRKMPDGQTLARVTQVIFPFMTLIPPTKSNDVRANRLLANCFVPRDDTSTWHFQWFFDHTQPIDVGFRINEGGHWIDADYRKLRNKDNWYLQDREAMKNEFLSGISGIATQDHAVGETQGDILDRTQEHLGNSDLAVVTWRRQMIRLARAFAEQGEVPPMLRANIRWNSLRAESLLYAEGRSWKEELPLDDSMLAGSAEAATD